VPDRRDGSITLINEAHEDVMTWSFLQAWINKIEGPSFNASGNEVAIESMELIHEGLSLED
jgi:phage tail-like protein